MNFPFRFNSPKRAFSAFFVALLLCGPTSYAMAATAATASFGIGVTSAAAYHTESFTHGNDRWSVSVPGGYELKFLASMDSPRMFAFYEGEMIVGSRSGYIYRLKAPYVHAETLLKTFGSPGSIAFRDGKMLVARTNGLYSVTYRKNRKMSWTDFSLVAKLPGGWGHTSRTVKVGPDGKIYLSLGISGNCSNQYLDESYSFSKRRGGVLLLDEQAKKAVWKVYSSGLRNPVGMAWHPLSGSLYASNNGPDHHGYEQPPEYFSRLTAGSFHGMPWFQFNGERLVRDGCVSAPPPRDDVSTPVATFPARNAPMGVAFIPASFSAAWRNNAVVALHGSWATLPDGGVNGEDASRRPPWIARVELGTEPAKVFPLLEGFQNKDGKRLARPMGIDFAPDGSLYFTSDGGAFTGLFRLQKVSSNEESRLRLPDKP